MSQPLSPRLLTEGTAVKAGTVLHRSRDGRPLEPGFGVTVAANGMDLVTTVEGMAIVDEWSAWVYPATVVRAQTVGLRPVATNGNLIILGDLPPGASITVGGSLGVVGNATQSKIRAFGDIVIVGDVGRSTVSAGVTHPAAATVADQVTALSEAFTKLMGILEQLKSHPGFRTMDLTVSLGPLVQTLIERHLAKLPAMISDVIRGCLLLSHERGTVEQLAQLLTDRFAGDRLFTVTLPDLQTAQQLAQRAVAQIRHVGPSSRNLTIVGDAVQSKLESTGGVELRAGNCVRTTVHSGLGVWVAGVITGSEIRAIQWIRAARAEHGGTLELLGTAFAPVRVAVGEQGGTLVKVGRLTAALPLPLAPVVLRQFEGHLELGPDQEVTKHE